VGILKELFQSSSWTDRINPCCISPLQSTLLKCQT